ncbi:MAG: hypothetical protein EOP05_12390 [Proteobacteria bacterium]|nr:MAG: hypothetical protein EOP05_12390 [Pseudomonadota bacterium]
MATTTTREPASSESASGFTDMASTWMPFAPFAKEMFSMQMKTAQMFMDQSVKLSQTFADFYQSQAAEGMKLTQACMTTGKGVAEELRRTATTMAETVAEKVTTRN